ncbi:MAG TPA: hypothetical protein VGK74_09415 [Symbiobacteriaceae bacterium]
MLMALLLLGNGLLATQMLQQANFRTGEADRTYEASIGIAAARVAFNQAKADLAGFLNAPVESVAADFDKAMKDVSQELDHQKALVSTDTTLRLLVDAEQSANGYGRVGGEVITLARAGKKDEALAKLTREAGTIGQQWEKSTSQLLATSTDLSAKAGLISRTAMIRVRLLILIFMSISVLMAILLALILPRRIAHQLEGSSATRDGTDLLARAAAQLAQSAQEFARVAEKAAGDRSRQ